MNFGARHKSTNTFFSQMRSRRVLVLRLGVRRLGVDAKSVRSVRKRPQASASVRKRPQASASVRKRPQASASARKRSPCVRKRPRPKIVRKRRTVVAFALALRLRVSKVPTVSGIGGVLIAKRKNVVTFGLAFVIFQNAQPLTVCQDVTLQHIYTNTFPEPLDGSLEATHIFGKSAGCKRHMVHVICVQKWRNLLM